MAGRPRALTAEQERQVAVLADARIPAAVIAAVLGISTRTVARTLARRRVEREPETLDELLAAFTTVGATVAPPRRRAVRRHRARWREAAAHLAALDSERWGLGGGAG